MKIHLTKSLNFTALSILVSMTLINNVSAEDTAAITSKASSNTSFPIAELGSCNNKKECKAYCDKKENIVVCANYAADHGMISKEQAAKAKEFSDAIVNGGPAGCSDFNSCQKVCSDTANIDECLAFGEKHSLLSTEELSKAKKAAQAIKNGGKLPGGCNNMKSCEAYCTVSSHLDECLAFAKDSGLMSQEEITEAQKVLPLIKEGKTPGKCTSKAKCQEYCDNGDHFDECISFAEQAGFVSKEEATIAKKVGGKGPGGCHTQASCDAYCNNPANTKECFNFAKEKGILSEEKVKQIEDGMLRLKNNFDQMPKEIKDCMNSSLGEDTLSQIKNGTLTPGPEIGKKIESCVESFKPKLMETLNKAFEIASPESLKCVVSALGEARTNEIKGGNAPTATEGDTIQKCFDKQREAGLKQAREGLSKMPPEMRACIESKLGADVVARIQAGDKEALSADSAAVFKACVGDVQSKLKEKVSENLSKIPDFAKDCVKQKLGNNFEEDLTSGKLSPSDIQGTVAVCMKDVVNNKYQGEGSYPNAGNVNIPSENKAPQQIPSGPQGMIPPEGMAPDASMCASLAQAPSCDFVPENLREICRKCKQ